MKPSLKSIQEKRDRIVYGKSQEWDKTDYNSFHGLNTKSLKQLLDEKLINPEETQNDSPSIQEFYDFMAKYPGCTAHGYVIGPPRDDNRISIEDITYDGPINDEMREEFIAMFRYADEFECSKTTLYCWYD